MKKAMVFLGVAVAGLITLPSCNKDYDCVCRLNGAKVETYSVREKSKNLAEDECNRKQSSLGVTYQCKIE
jgi:hypothetical protein